MSPTHPATDDLHARRTRLRSALVGIVLTVVACACFALLDTATKLVSVGVPLLMALWMRYLFQSLLTTAFVLHREGLAALRTTQPRFQALRGALFTATSLFGFISIMHMPLAEFTAVVATTPLCVTVVAALWLQAPLAAAQMAWHIPAALRWVQVGFELPMAVLLLWLMLLLLAALMLLLLILLNYGL